MLSIGEFSHICKVSTKTLRYYAQIGLILPAEIDPENGYRYYSIHQLETMLLINRLKTYHLSLNEIKKIIELNESQETVLYMTLNQKKNEIEKQLQTYQKTLKQIEEDMRNIKEGKSMMAFLDNIFVELTQVPSMNLLSIRKMVPQNEFPREYQQCFTTLSQRINEDHLTMSAPPMVLFHGDEFTSLGLDTEFAIPIKEIVIGTREFTPGLCLKTTLHGSYLELPSVYTKQREWVEQNGYENNGAVFEVYVNDPSMTTNENDLITEVYYPIRKRGTYEPR